MVERLEGWEKRYSQFLIERKKMPHEWGTNDCMQFVARGVESITGINFYEPYSTYEDEEGAKNVLEKHNGIIEIMNSHLGQSHRNYKKAKRGDPVVFRTKEIIGGLVSDCGEKILGVSDQGWIKIPLNKAYRIWSI